MRRLAPALLLSLAPVLGAGQAAVVHVASGDCTPSGSQSSCTFTYTGTEQTWQVPPGISSVTITAVGGSGSSYVLADGTTVPGGKGARVAATVPLPAGTTVLYVEVGAPSTPSISEGWGLTAAAAALVTRAATPPTCAGARWPSAGSSSRARTSRARAAPVACRTGQTPVRVCWAIGWW